MGAGESKSNNPTQEGEQQDELYNEDHYQYIGQYQDPRLGEIKLVEHKQTKVRLAVKSKHCTTKEEWEAETQQLEGLKYISHPNILRVVDIRTEKDEGFCGQVYLLRTVYEYINFDLEQETLSRVHADTEERQYYSEEEIVHLLQNVLAGLEYLRERDIIHGDITSKNILITNDINGNKIHKLHIPLYTNQQNHYAKVLRQEEEAVYLSPQQFEALGQQQINPDLDQEKAQIFALGIIGLQVALLEETNSCYNFQDYSIQHDVVQAKLQQIADRYSEQLAHILISFLETDVSTRATFQEGLEQLSQHPQAKDITAEVVQDFQQQSPLTQQLINSQHQQQEQNQETNQSQQQVENFQQFEPQYDNQEGMQNQEVNEVQEEEEGNIAQKQELHAVPYFSQSQASPNIKSKVNVNANTLNVNATSNNNNITYTNDQLQTSIKNIDQMYREAVNRSDESKSRYDSNIQLRSFLKELLDDEIFVPIHQSPQKKINYSKTKVNKSTRQFRADQQWKI
ncbi:Protein kinase-like domain [Pseudocohnilembus persalinus]|uniref:non-specific serine/threonine protein kinase n=1 Tax=Pseudocohnilembus persalinus TaxID=266149 RepID=A0A0V0QCT6_PSEPJ|nr:Protein kinase-like domain [Pseudocohnilembus persalinus]|eukprot:KRX00003.1 Protein kinase-like domain [Pseudocohnilembus persalinus]